MHDPQVLILLGVVLAALCWRAALRQPHALERYWNALRK